jgi:uncharacterized protein (DUF983 family)
MDRGGSLTTQTKGGAGVEPNVKDIGKPDHTSPAPGSDLTSTAEIPVVEASPRRVIPLFWRAVRLRCPNCGGSGLWRDYFHMRQSCPTCSLHLERGEPGYIVGAQMFNIIAAELVFAAIFVAVLVATLPEAPWALLQYGGMALMVVLPIVFYPFSKTAFLAFDLILRPATAEDFT